ncbi:MAG: TIGR02556 family CRISPR-associated protein [candidate division WOR-3 bacterium]
MLTAIWAIGRWQRHRERIGELSTLIQEPFRDKNKDGKVMFIKIDLDENRYCGLELEDYERGKLHKYLYRRGSPNGPNPSPAAVITTPEKTFNGKILAFFKRHSGAEDSNNLINRIKELLSTHNDDILREIIDRINQYGKRPYLLTLKIRHNQTWNYIGDLQIFQDLLRQNAQTETARAAAGGKNCCLCGEQKGVSGDPRVFKFYTIDKPGFIAGGFNKKDAWKNFPVCYECKLELEAGRKYIEQNLSFKFYGLSYLLIPDFLIGTVENNQEILDILINSRKNVSLKDKKRITNDEEEILNELKQQQDTLTITLLFMEKEQGAERILLTIEDVYPSRLRVIFDAKDDVDRIFNNNFTFGNIRTFFRRSSEGKKTNDLDNYFLTIVDSVFKNHSLNPGFLFNFLMQTIRHEFIQERDFQPRVTDALMTVLFLLKLRLLTFQEVNNMTEGIFEPLFSRYAGLFGSEAKKGVLLLGVLTQLLLKKQHDERGRTSFRKYLKSLRMSETDFRALLPKVQNKLEEYNSFDKGKRQIATEAARYLLAAGENWRIPLNELNFYFACGMNLAEEIARIVYSQQE